MKKFASTFLLGVLLLPGVAGASQLENNTPNSSNQQSVSTVYSNLGPTKLTDNQMDETAGEIAPLVAIGYAFAGGVAGGAAYAGLQKIFK